MAGGEEPAPASAERLLEAALLMEGQPTSLNKLQQITQLSLPSIRTGLEKLRERLRQHDSGLQLVEIAEGFALSPSRDLWAVLQRHYHPRDDHRLSRAALETLAIIAYTQPATRGEIEGIRGVAPDGMIRQLMKRGLVAEISRREAPGRPIQYGTTSRFLTAAHLRSIVDLPRLQEDQAAKFD